jgi:hypothetical protein
VSEVPGRCQIEGCHEEATHYLGSELGAYIEVCLGHAEYIVEERRKLWGKSSGVYKFTKEEIDGETKAT